MIIDKKTKQYYYCCCFDLYNDDVLINKYEDQACFSSAWRNDYTKIIIHLKDNRTPEFIEKYISFLNSFLKDLEYNQADNTVTVKRHSLIYCKIACTAISYLWENGKNKDGYSKEYDMFILIPDLAFKLFEKYEINELLALAIAHYNLKQYNTGHAVFSKYNIGHIDYKKFEDAFITNVNTQNTDFQSTLKGLIKNPFAVFENTVSFEEILKTLNLKERNVK